jgi:TolA-binding protein
VNLGLVQYERGQWDSARRVFETVRTQFAGSPLEDRATALLAGLLNG